MRGTSKNTLWAMRLGNLPLTALKSMLHVGLQYMQHGASWPPSTLPRLLTQFALFCVFILLRLLLRRRLLLPPVFVACFYLFFRPVFVSTMTDFGRIHTHTHKPHVRTRRRSRGSEEQEPESIKNLAPSWKVGNAIFISATFDPKPKNWYVSLLLPFSYTF